MSSDDKELAESLRQEAVWRYINEYEKFPAIFTSNYSLQPVLDGNGKEPPVKATATGEDDFEELKRRVASLGVKDALELYKYIKMQLGI